MNKAVVVLMILTISILSQAQTMLNPVALNLINNDYKGSSLSLDGYIQKRTDKSDAECTNRIAQQMIDISKKNNKDFNLYSTYTKAIGAKLKQIDNRCKYYRFELIDYVENGAMSIRLAYRCYENSEKVQPYLRVSHIDPAVINPGMFHDDKKLMKEKCDALEILKGLSAKPAKSMKSDSEEKTPATMPAKKIPSNQTKKGSGQN